MKLREKKFRIKVVWYDRRHRIMVTTIFLQMIFRLLHDLIRLDPPIYHQAL